MIDFLKRRKIFYIFSGGIVILGLLSIIIRGKNSLGIDFTGGTMINLKFSKEVTEEKLSNIREKMEKEKIACSIQYIGTKRDELIIKVKEDASEEIGKKIRDIAEDIGKFSYSSTYVGPAVSRHLVSYSLKAIFIALIAMLIYIGIRFEFRFGVIAMLTLIHDIIGSLGIYILMGRECNVPTLAAFLTIAGYSVNDTIVLFDRIRENLKLLRKEDFYILINKSLNQVLTRTLLTSITTLFTSVCIWLFGRGEVSDFAFALTIGIIIGTLSSICLASPLLYEWHIRSKVKK